MNDCSCKPGFVPAPQNPKQMNGCSPCAYITTELLPANLGDDNPKNLQWAPKKGRWHDKVVVYMANGASYFYDHNGIYTQLSMGQAGVQSVNEMTGIVTLPNLTLKLGEKVLGQFNAGEPVTISLPIPELGEVAEGNGGYISGDLAYQLQQALQASLETEVANRQAGDAGLEEKITNLQSGLSSTADNVNTISQEVDTINQTLDQTVQRDMTIFADEESVTITKTSGNIGAGNNEYNDLPVPMASTTSAGCITATQLAQLEAAGNRANNLYWVTGQATLPTASTGTLTGYITLSQWTAPKAGRYLVTADFALAVAGDADFQGKADAYVGYDGVYAISHRLQILPSPDSHPYTTRTLVLDLEANEAIKIQAARTDGVQTVQGIGQLYILYIGDKPEEA